MLPDNELTEEAYAALRNQPKLWINGHFLLDQQQLDFLQQMPTEAASFLGLQGGFAIEHRLPINLHKANQPKSAKDGDKEQDKLFKPTSNLSIQTDNEGITIASGELNLEVTYFNEP